MVKLRDAKCPNCGGNIQVNEKLENTICQYCGSQVLIEEAIEKYKVELSGKVEVEGIKGRTTQLKQAKKHFAIEEYDEAKDILLEIIDEDNFDVEAYVELIKVNVEKLRQREFNENSSSLTDYDSWQLLDEIIEDFKRIRKIDEDNIAEEKLGEYLESVKHYESLNEQVKIEEKELKEYVDRLNNYWEKIKTMKYENYTYWLNQIVGKYFDFTGVISKYSHNNNSRYCDWYDMANFSKITRDGVIDVTYKNRTKIYNTQDEVLHKKEHKIYKSVEEVKSNLDKLMTDTEQYMKKNKVPKNPTARKIYQCSVCGYKGEYWNEKSNLKVPIMLILILFFWPAAILYGAVAGTKTIRECPNCKTKKE